MTYRFALVVPASQFPSALFITRRAFILTAFALTRMSLAIPYGRALLLAKKLLEALNKLLASSTSAWLCLLPSK